MFVLVHAMECEQTVTTCAHAQTHGRSSLRCANLEPFNPCVIVAGRCLVWWSSSQDVGETKDELSVHIVHGTLKGIFLAMARIRRSRRLTVPALHPHTAVAGDGSGCTEAGKLYMACTRDIHSLGVLSSPNPVIVSPNQTHNVCSIQYGDSTA